MPFSPEFHAARERKKAAGGRIGGPAPYGWRWRSGELIPHETEQHIVWLARHLNARGLSHRRIAEQFNQLGIPTLPRSTSWRADAVHRIVTREPLQDTG